jgi:hypothetical protein
MNWSKRIFVPDVLIWCGVLRVTKAAILSSLMRSVSTCAVAKTLKFDTS